MAQNPALAPAVMVGLAGLFSARRRSGGVPGGGLAKLGGLALIGTLAYKAYQNRQAGKPLLDTGGIAGSVAGALGGLGQGRPAGEPKPGAEGQPQGQAAGTLQNPSSGQGATPGTGSRQGDVTHAPDALEIPKDSEFHPVSQTEDDALLYLRAMVAAASADGHIDEAERARILKGLTEAGIDPEATRWLERELASPADVEELSANVNTPEKAAQVYAAARIAIDPDTMQEREFLRQLAEALDLDQAMKAQIDDTGRLRGVAPVWSWSDPERWAALCSSRLSFRQELAHSLESPSDVFGRVGVGEADIAFAVDAEIRSADGRDAGLLQERRGERLCLPAGPGDVREGVERALRGDAGDARQRVEALDHELPAPVELGDHRVGRSPAGRSGPRSRPIVSRR